MAAGEVSIGSLNVQIGGDSSPLAREAKIAEQNMRNLERVTANTVAKIKASMLAIAGPAALGYLIKKSIDAISEQKDLAERLNSTVEGVQVMQRAAQLAGVSLEEMNKAADRLQRKLGEASRDAKGEAADAFKKLGLSAKDFAGLNIDEKFELMFKKVKELGLSTVETADLIGKFGIRGGRLGTMFLEGADNIEEARKQLKAFGVLLDDVSANKIEAAGDALSIFGQTSRGIGTSLAVELSPFIIQASKDFLKLNESMGSSQDTIRALVDGGVEVVAAFMTIGDQLKVEFKEWADAALETVNAIIRTLNRVADIPGVKLLGGKLIEEMKWTDVNFTGVSTSLIMTKEELEKKLGRPLTAEAFKKWVKEARDAADEAAQIAADAKQDRAQDDEEFGLGKPGLGTKEREALEKKLLAFKASLANEAEAAKIHREQQLEQAKEFYEKGILDQQKYAELKKSIDDKFNEDNAKKKWERFQSEYATELEILAYQHTEKLKLLKEYEDARTITEEEAAQMRQKLNEKYEQKKIETIAQNYSALAGIVDTAMGAINDVVGSEGKKGFTVMKAISMATALAKGFEATVSAYAAGAKTGIPGMGEIMAATAAAGTAAIIAKLAGVNVSGGGGSSSVAGAGSAASAAGAGAESASSGQGGPKGPQSIVVKGLNPREWMSGDNVRHLAEELLTYQRNGGTVLFDETK